MVGVLDFVFDEDKPSDKRLNPEASLKIVRHEIKLKDQHCNVFYDKLTYIFLQMPNFEKQENELETNFDKWLYVLKRLPRFEDRPLRLQEKIFERLFEAAEIARFTPVEKDQYEASLKAYRDNYNTFNYAMEEAKAKGEARGEARGEIKAKKEGVLKALKRKKLSIEEIAEDFDVEVDFILRIQQENP